MNPDNPLRELRVAFRAQLLVRSFIGAGLTAALIFGIGLISANFDAWWFDLLPWLTDVSRWLKDQNSWDLFVYVFIGVNLMSYVQLLQGIALDRHNMKVLVDLSQRELFASPDPTKDAAKRRAMLTARRRVLESLFSADPAMFTLVILAVALLILGHAFSALTLVAFGASLAWFFPRMIRRFDELRAASGPEEDQDETGDTDEAGALALLEESKDDRKFTPEERKVRREQRKLMSTPDDQLSPEDQERKIQIRRDRAQSNLDNAAERIFIMVNRPLVKLKVAWPVVVMAAIAVGGVATFTITDMARSGALPQQGTLLLVLLVLTGRTCLSVAQKSEDLAFYSSAMRAIALSEDGQDTL